MTSIERCTGCGGWVWLPDRYGCQTCRLIWARHGVTPPAPPK